MRLFILFLSLTLIAHAEPLSPVPPRLAWSPDGRLVSCASNQAVTVYDLAGRRWSVPHGDAFSVAFSPDGSRLACGRLGEILQMHDARDGKLLWKVASGRKETRYSGLAVRFSPSGQHVITWGAGGGRSDPDPYLRWFAVKDGKQERKLKGMPYATDDSRLWAVGTGEVVQIVDATGKPLRQLKLEKGWTPEGFRGDSHFMLEKPGELDGPKLGPGRLKLVNLSSGQEELHQNVPAVVGSAPDGRLILAYGDGLYDLASGQTTRTGGWPVGFAGGAAVVDNLSTIRVVDLASGKDLLVLDGEARFSPDGKRLAVVAEQGVDLYDPTTWKLSHRLR